MRLKHFGRYIQLLLFLSLFLFMLPIGCNRFSKEPSVLPPVTHPLTREYIGFGVLNISFAHVLSEPGPKGVSQGYLRRGTVVRVIERLQISNRGNSELWVLAEGNYQGAGNISRGWLEEAALVIYDSERRANTASKSLSQ